MVTPTLDSSRLLSFSQLKIGQRYLYTSKGQVYPITVRALLPHGTTVPATENDGQSSKPSTPLVGIEYDDETRGKHSGTLEGRQVFTSKRVNAASFIKYDDKRPTLSRGYTFVEALSERYGVEMRVGDGTESSVTSETEQDQTFETVILGGSGGAIHVEAPNIDGVSRRMKQMSRLKSVGLEGFHVSSLGGGSELRDHLVRNMTALVSLNLSKSLLASWRGVYEIVECLPQLKELVLNGSRISHAEGDSDENFKMEGVRDLSMCECDLDNQDLADIVTHFPLLEQLCLSRNSRLSLINHIVFQFVTELDVAACGITAWQAVVDLSKCFPRLQTLDISSTLISDIPPAPDSATVTLPYLIWHKAHLRDWRSVDNLARWTNGTLRSLRFTLNSDPSTHVDDSVPATHNHSHLIENDEQHVRLIIIAKIASLEVLNSSKITPAERRDAEIHYLAHVRRVNPSTSDGWGRYEELVDKHSDVSRGAGRNGEGESDYQDDAGPKSLKFRLIELQVYTDSLDNALSISVLPATPLSLFRKKLAKLIGVPISSSAGLSIWTTKPGSRDRAVKVEMGQGEGGTVGWWFEPGDGVLVER